MRSAPKFSALYNLVDGAETGLLGRVNLNLYAAYSEAFKPPRHPSSLNPPGQDANLEPENITNYEVGLKGSFLDGRGSLQATYFNMERDGVVISTQEGPLFRDSNAGKQDFEGLELTAAWVGHAQSQLLRQRGSLSQPLRRVRHRETERRCCADRQPAARRSGQDL